MIVTSILSRFVNYSTLAIFDYGIISAKPLANAVSICALHPYDTSGMNENMPLRKNFREGLKEKQAPSDFLVTSIRMNRQIRVSDGAMFTHRIKKKVNLCNTNLDFMVEMRDRFVLPNARKNFCKNPI